MDNALRISRDDCAGRIDRCFGAAAHNGQRAVFCAGLSASYRRIDNEKSARLGLDTKLPGNARGNRCVIDIQAALAHGCKRTVSSKCHASQVIVGTNATDDDLCVLGGVRWRSGQAAAMFSHPVFSLGTRTVVHRQVMSRPYEVSSHRGAHDAQSDKSYSSHAPALMFVFT